MITYLTLAIAVCTLVLVIFMSFDVLRNRAVVDKTREDIEMIKKNVKELKHPVRTPWKTTSSSRGVISKSTTSLSWKYPYKKKESSSPVTARISRKSPPSPT